MSRPQQCQMRRRRRSPRQSHDVAPRWLAGETEPRRLDWTATGRAAATARIEAPVFPLASEELALLGLDAEALGACRRRRGHCFDSRIEQLVAARLLVRLEWNTGRGDELVEPVLDRELGRAVLSAAFGPVNRGHLERYWDAIHEYAGGEPFWLYSFMQAFIWPALRQADPSWQL